MKTTHAHRLTQRDIALKCGVSQMTVSLALRGSPKVSRLVRNHILRKAKQLGWKPDPALSALVNYRHQIGNKRNLSTIGWITGNAPGSSSQDASSAHRAYLQGARARAEALGYTIEEFCVNGKGMTPGRLDHILYNRNIAALLIPPQPASSSLKLSWDRFAAVTCGFASSDPCFHMATSHHIHSAVLAFQKLRSLGYRRVGVLLEQSTGAGTGFGLMEGCLTEQRRYLPGQILPITSLPELTAALLREYLTRNKPDVLLTNFTSAAGHLDRLDISVPRELGLAFLSSTLSDSIMSGVNENAYAVGEVSAELVAGMIQRNESGIPANPRCVMVDGFWVEGRTVRQVSKPAKERQPSMDSFQYWMKRISPVTSI